jgi:hypothetical protein
VAQMQDATDPNEKFAFTEYAIRNLLKQLEEWVSVQTAIVKEQGAIGFSGPVLSVREMTNAMREVNKDLGFLAERRNLHKSGISPGKVAGILAYRLTRHRLLHFSDGDLNEKGIEGFQESVILSLVLDALQIHWNSEWIQGWIGRSYKVDGVFPARWHLDLIKELSYLLRKRHCNQETLAVIFEAMAFLDTAIRQIHQKDEEIKDLKIQIDKLKSVVRNPA